MRDPMSFTPFLFGERKCIGYQFAKVLIPMITIQLLHNFDIELQDPELLQDEHKFPVAQVFQS